MRRTLKAIGATLGLLISGSAYAQFAPAGYYRDPNAFRHDGLYLHFDTGPAYLSSTFSSPNFANEVVSGPAWSFGGSLGGALAPNLIIAGDLFGMIAVSPSYTHDGITEVDPDYSLSLVGIGPELVYYFSPSNIYLSGTVAFTYVTQSFQGVEVSRSGVGLGGRVTLGKEWWLAPRFGLGVAGQFLFASNPNTDFPSSRINTWGAGVNFSLTWN